MTDEGGISTFQSHLAWSQKVGY
uniref:Uncharacterized protein n=1 Tax=Rhizophora mucronata TaxID=61149 RepID=A0A2P2L2G1_RHIMU